MDDVATRNCQLVPTRSVQPARDAPDDARDTGAAVACAPGLLPWTRHCRCETQVATRGNERGGWTCDLTFDGGSPDLFCRARSYLASPHLSWSKTHRLCASRGICQRVFLTLPEMGGPPPEFVRMRRYPSARWMILSNSMLESNALINCAPH